MPKEYKECKALLNALKEERKNGNFVFTSKWIKEIMDNLPTADVVEVVRCKNCACFIERTEEDDNDFPVGYGYCSHDKAVFGYLPPDHFCGYGERKDK